jgi:hypothetical protein
LRKLALVAPVFAFLFFVQFAAAQQADASFGFGTLLSSGSSACDLLTSSCVIPEKGGLYPNINLDVIFHKRVGFDFETTWRGSQGNYAGLGEPYRPIILDFNAMYQPKLSKKAGLDLMGGVGFQSTRFYGYTYTTSCEFYGACYNSSNHFLVDAGAGLRYYVWGHVFVRPEVRFYHINNNTDAFSNNNVVRVGASIGYTIGGGPGD